MTEETVLTTTFANLSTIEQLRALDSLRPKEVPSDADAAPPPLTVAQFADEPHSPLTFLVEDLIARGNLLILSGRPKSGKSWFTLQLAQAVDTGTPFLGRATTPGRVLCLMLEGGRASHNRRINALGWRSQQSSITFRLDSFDSPSGDIGPGLEQVAALAGGYDLLIIDTLAASLSGRANENDNSAMGAIMREIARIAYAADCAIMLVHHTNKGFSDDIFNTSRGASAIRGGYDVGLVLERGNNEREAVLHIEARDFTTDNIAIRQSAEGSGWELVGGVVEIKRIRAGRRVIAALEDLGEATAEELCKELNLSRSAVSSQLARAERDGLVVRQVAEATGAGRPPELWSLAPAQTELIA